MVYRGGVLAGVQSPAAIASSVMVRVALSSSTALKARQSLLPSTRLITRQMVVSSTKVVGSPRQDTRSRFSNLRPHPLASSFSVGGEGEGWVDKVGQWGGLIERIDIVCVCWYWVCVLVLCECVLVLCECTCPEENLPEKEVDSDLHGVSRARLVAAHPEGFDGGEGLDGHHVHDARELLRPPAEHPARATGGEDAQTKPLRCGGGGSWGGMGGGVVGGDGGGVVM